MLWVDEETKLGLIVDEIVGFENDQFTYMKTTIDDDQTVTKEWMIEMLAEKLKEGYPSDMRNNTWFPIRFATESGQPANMRRVVDMTIDGNPTLWMGRDGPCFYSEDDRRRIVRRCAEGIAKRLKKYEKKRKIQFKVFDNGEVGCRYE